jgi:hypothetical protein
MKYLSQQQQIRQQLEQVERGRSYEQRTATKMERIENQLLEKKVLIGKL